MNEIICIVLIAVVGIVGGIVGYFLSKAAPAIRNYIKSFIRWNFK